MLCCLQSPCFFDLLTLLRLSMAKSKIALGKCHIALENMWVIFTYLSILICNIIPLITDSMILIPLDHEKFAPCFMSLDMFQYLLVNSLWKLEFVSYLRENYVNLNYVDLVHSAFQAYYILLFCMFILLIFESLMLKL